MNQIKHFFQSHGWGVTQTNQSLTGGAASRTSKTPTTPHEPQVRQDGVARDLLNRVRQNKAKKESATAHVHYNDKNLKGCTADLQKLNEWKSIFDAERGRRFVGSTAPQLLSLEKQLQWVQARLPADFKQTPDVRSEPRDQRVLPGATMITLLNATSNVANKCGLNADEVARGLACLHHIDVVGAIENPYGAAAGVPVPAANVQPQPPGGGAFNQQDVANAWRLAIELERSGEAGFNLLKHLMVAPAAGGHPTVARQRDALLHTYLQAAREKASETFQLGEPLAGARATRNILMPDPRSIHEHINTRLNPPGTPANAEPGMPPADGVHVVGTVGGRVLPSGPAPIPTATLLDKALKAVSNHMQQVQAHAANPATAGQQITFDRNHGDIREGTNPASYRILSKDCNWWAANAVRNGIYSDAPQANEGVAARLYNKLTGRTSRVTKLYPKILQRSEKVQDWLHRANDNNSRAGVTKWDKIGRRAEQAAAPTVGKSPFHAFNNIVVDSPHRLDGATDASGISDGRAMRQDIIQQLEKAIEQGGRPPAAAGGARVALRDAVYPPAHAKAGQAAVADNPPQDVLRQMVRLAILKHQHRFPDGGVNLFITRHNEGDPLQFEDVNRAKQKVYDMLAGGQQGQGIGTLLALDRIFAEENVQLSPDRLLNWAVDVGAGDVVPGLQQTLAHPGQNKEAREAFLRQVVANNRANPAPAPANWAQPDWNKFMEGVNRVLLGEIKPFGQPITDLTELSDKAAGRLFEEIIARQELGHVMDLRDGGWHGIKTQGLSYLLTKLATIGLGGHGVGIDLRYQKGKHALIQSGTGTGGRDLFVGTSKADRNQVGIGYNYGPGHVSKKGDGWSAGLAAGGNATLFNGEWAESNGVQFRFRRTFSGVDSDDIGNKQLGRLTRKLMDPGHNPRANEGGAWTNPGDPNDQNVLKQVLHEFDDVSIGWRKSKDKTFKSALSGSAVAGFKVGPAWAPGVSAGIGGEVAKSKSTWREEGGSLNQERDVTSFEAKVSLNGALSLIAATLGNLDLPDNHSLHELLNPAIWGGAIKQGFQDGVMAGADVFRTGTARRHTWIYHDGALTYTPGICSFYQKTHKNAASFVANVLKKVEQRAHDKAKVFEANRYYGAAPATPEEAKRRDDERRQMVNQETIKLLQDLHAALKGAKPTQEFREYFEYSSKFLQMINDLESVIRSEKNDPNWKKNPEAKARVKDYEKQLAKLKSLDDETINQHGEYRFNIKDNVESKTKNLGANLPIVNLHENTFRGQRIDIYN
jgi:hypothetical protein